jgi:hypothetical protein
MGQAGPVEDLGKEKTLDLSGAAGPKKATE